MVCINCAARNEELTARRANNQTYLSKSTDAWTTGAAVFRRWCPSQPRSGGWAAGAAGASYLFTTAHLQGELCTVFVTLTSKTQLSEQAVRAIEGFRLLLRVGKKRQKKTQVLVLGSVQTWQQCGRQRGKMHHKDGRVRPLHRFLSGKLHLSFSRLRVARYFANSQKCGPADTDDWWALGGGGEQGFGVEMIKPDVVWCGAGMGNEERRWRSWCCPLASLSISKLA